MILNIKKLGKSVQAFPRFFDLLYDFLRLNIIGKRVLFNAIPGLMIYVDRISRKGGKFRLPVKTPLLGPDVRISFFKDDGAFYLGRMITMPDDGGCSPKGNVSIDEADVSLSPYFVGKERNFSSVSRNGAVPCFYGDMAGKTVSQRIRIKFLMIIRNFWCC